ncbi:MAG: radical SAM protein [Chitinivibrionales bacterium]|nr:radical SAM protein [Chitinivibrionales bacterium]MBD3395247.1 radical SAM protein [Chitinivibrionales bacterium]
MAKKSSIASFPDLRERNRLVRRRNDGEFWKPCPGTTGGYLCCGYQILSPLTGCGMHCSYCVLQVYFAHQHQVLFTNFGDLAAEVRRKLEAWPRRVVRFGTGEFADSLYLEDRLGLCRKTAALLEPYDNVLVECKTKSAAVGSLSRIRRPEKVVVGFSLNTPPMVQRHEKATASITERLRAARQCERMGFWVSFHFDPMLWYPGWEKDYRALVDRAFSAIRDPARIAWWSLGGFRTTPSLKTFLGEYGRRTGLFSGEMVLGQDHKLRYFRPVRVDFYRAMREQVEKIRPETTLYLCMESPEVWRDCGMANRIPRGLVACLDDRAIEMLGL